MNGQRYSRDFLAYIEKRRNSGSLHITTTSKANVVKLASERIDVFVDTLASVNWQAAQIGHQDDIKSLNFIVRSGEYFLTLSKRSNTITDKKAFIVIFNECTQALKESGEFNVMASRYGLTIDHITLIPK